MNGEMRCLIGKEWSERRTAFAICAVWMLLCVVYVVAYEWTHRFRAPAATFYQASMLYSMFAAVCLAMKTALGEATQGTLGFSLSLPVSRSRLAWIRLAGAVLTLVLPVILGAIALTPFLLFRVIEQAPVRPTEFYVQLPQRPSLSPGEAVELLWTVSAIAIAGGIQLLLMLSILGTRRTSEAQVGFLGALLAFGWLTMTQVRMSLGSANGWLGAIFPVSLIINYGYGVENGSYTDLDVGHPIWAPLGVNALLLVVLANWFVHRYSAHRVTRVGRQLRIWQRLPSVWSRISYQLPNETAALVWINLRQSVSLALCGLLLAAAITFMQYASFEEDQSFRSQLPSTTWFVAMLWAVVVGVGVFAAELQPGLSRFWRSRPIAPSTWFWCKFLTGLFAVIAVLDGVTILVGWGTPIGHTTGMSWSYVACMPLLHATLYAVAVFGICWTRRPILGGVLAMGVYFVLSTLVTFRGESFEPINIHNLLLGDEIKGQLDLSAHHYQLVYGTLVAISIASALLAFLAIRAPERKRLFAGRGIAIAAG